MPRLMLTDEPWGKLKHLLLRFGIYDKENLKITVEGILYRMRTGNPWRDLPPYFGKWETVYRLFHRWSKKGIPKEIFRLLVQEPNLEHVFIDGSYVSAHQHSSGVAHGQEAAIGKSRGGNTSKIHLMVDANGEAITFVITGGEVHDSTPAPTLIQQLKEEDCDFIVADKGYDSDPLREQIRKQGTTPIIPRRKNSTKTNEDFDSCFYKFRHLVENSFARIKHFRAIATRYDKLKRNYASMVALAFCLTDQSTPALLGVHIFWILSWRICGNDLKDFSSSTT